MSNNEWCFYTWREVSAHVFLGPNNATDVWLVKKVNPQSNGPPDGEARRTGLAGDPGENVLDQFGGSGSTLIASEQAGRYAYLMELDPPYCDVIVQRWEQFTGRNNRPTRTGAIVKHIGEGFHVNYLRAERLYLVEVDADHWKTWVHQRLSTPLGKAGAMSLFQAPPQEHLALAKHLTAETKTEEFVAGRGVVVKWERLRRQNHWFDALYNACAAGSMCGVRLMDDDEEEPVRLRATQRETRRIVRNDGSPWIDTDRAREAIRRLMG